jgi:predicted metal-binding protein
MQEKYRIYMDRCLELGASECRIVDVKKDVVFAEWVRLKCQFGCQEYGKHLTCPPHMPDYEFCKNLVLAYTYGLLVKFRTGGPNKSPEDYRNTKNKIRRTLSLLERQLVLDQFYKAFSLHNGPCTLCEICVIEDGKGGGKNILSVCRHHKVARPAMESMGIDVFQTVRNAGWEPSILKSFFEAPTYYGLILIE